MEMDSEQTSLKELIESFVQDNRLDMNIAIPGVIKSFDGSKQTARVEVQIKKKLVDGTILKPATLSEVPVQQFTAGGFSITLPIRPEDGCLLIFAQRDITNWQKDGGASEPASDRSYDISDAIAIVGLNSEKKSIANYNPNMLEIRNSEQTATIQIASNGTINMKADAGLNIQADVNISGAVTASGEIHSDTDVTAESISLKGHDHTSGGTLIGYDGFIVQGNTGTPQ